MKTTLDIQDELMVRARELAHRERRTLRSVVEEALQIVLERHAATPDYELPDLSVEGEGLSDEFRDGGWDAVAAAVWQGRGS